jgi:hypothetical protein
MYTLLLGTLQPPTHAPKELQNLWSSWDPELDSSPRTTAWRVHQFCWLAQCCFHGTVWDWAGLLNGADTWLWAILIHLDIGWVHDSGLPTAQGWLLTVSCIFGTLHPQLPLVYCTRSGRWSLPVARTQGSSTSRLWVRPSRLCATCNISLGLVLPKFPQESWSFQYIHIHSWLHLVCRLCALPGLPETHEGGDSSHK